MRTIGQAHWGEGSSAVSDDLNFVSKSFGSSNEVAPADDGLDDGPSWNWRELGTKTLVTSGAGAALLVLGVVMVFGSSTPSVSPADQEAIGQLQSQIDDVRGQRDSLPSTKDADRDLIKALDAANGVADAQNSYRMLAVDVDKDGTLEKGLTAAGERSLSPLLDPASTSEVFGPWYLLASDAKVPVGIGIPETFGSGFAWQAQVPSVISDDGSVPVTWVATQTATAKGHDPQVLAWAQGSYDTTRQVFTDVRVGTTTTGQGLGLEVKN